MLVFFINIFLFLRFNVRLCGMSYICNLNTNVAIGNGKIFTSELSVTYSCPHYDTLHSSPVGQWPKNPRSHMIIYLESDWFCWIWKDLLFALVLHSTRPLF